MTGQIQIRRGPWAVTTTPLDNREGHAAQLAWFAIQAVSRAIRGQARTLLASDQRAVMACHDLH
jgi:hypothetical protein